MKTIILVGVLVILSCSYIQANEEKILLKTQIPAPRFSSQIIHENITNLEPMSLRPKQLYVPVGTTNLALGKPVTASCKPVNGTLDLLTDGDKAGDDGSWMELPAGPQWVQIDLGRQANIYGVWVWHFHQHKRVYFDVVVAVSDDPEFKQGVNILFNNDVENVMGFGKGSDLNYFDGYLGKLIDAKGVKGRYVRLYSNGNNENKMNHYVEVEVFGISDKSH